MTRLEAFCDAIKTYEGWYIGSRSWRNNNPGNLRYSKFQITEAGGFAKFSNFGMGWLALAWDVLHKCYGKTKTGLGPESDLYDFFRVWAPTQDGNNNIEYTKWVAAKLGIPTSTKLKWFTEDINLT